MKPTVQRIAVAGALVLGLAVSAAAAQDRPARPQGAAGPRGADRQTLFEQMQRRREQRMHDLLQIKPDQETAFRTFVASVEQSPRVRGPGQGGPVQGGPRGAVGERKPLTTPERLDRETQRLAQLQQRLAAVKTFYAALSAEQRKAFDAMPMGVGFREDGPRRWSGGHMMRGRFEGRQLPPIR